MAYHVIGYLTSNVAERIIARVDIGAEWWCARRKEYRLHSVQYVRMHKRRCTLPRLQLGTVPSHACLALKNQALAHGRGKCGKVLTGTPSFLQLAKCSARMHDAVRDGQMIKVCGTAIKRDVAT